MKVIAALYEFKALDDPVHEFRHKLLKFCIQYKILGTLLISQEEGINGTVVGKRESIDELKTYLYGKGFQHLTYKESEVEDDQKVFLRMKVKVKKEIVTMGVEGLPLSERGRYVEPENWNDLLSRDDVVIIDTRNEYEYQVGTFRHAINPHIQTFREFPAYLESKREELKDKVVAMFCTGGIRCEKSTAYAVHKNIGKEVYHLHGGILEYLQRVPESESLWEGECFVFDNRVTVKHGTKLGSYQQCFACRMPISQEEMESPMYQKGVSCPHCYGKKTTEQMKRYMTRQQQQERALQQGKDLFAPKEYEYSAQEV